MKILLVGPGKLKYMPYVWFYLNNIDCVANEVHIAYWNRDCKKEDTSSFDGIQLHEFCCFMNNDEPLKTKFVNFRKYRKFCKPLLKQHFDLIIVLHSLSGMMIFDKLRLHRIKYILDYRDSTYESRNGLFAYIVKALAKNSVATFVSSDSFRKFLPKDCSTKIYTSHNLLEESLSHRNYVKIPSNKIRMAFWGFIRHVEVNKKIIDAIANDKRLEVHYYGREQKDALELKDYSKSIGAENVFFHGEYNPQDRYKFVAKTDLIHNIYSGANENMAMGNKYYDSLIFRIPQVCQVGSFMGDMCSKSGVGIELNPCDPQFAEKLVGYYKSLNREVFIKACDIELERILKEYQNGQELIKKIVKI